MEPINNIQNQQSQISIEPLQALPEEMKMLIFSQLNEMDIEQASKIKPWNKIFVDVVKKQEFEKIKAFVNWTIAQLKSDDYIEVKSNLKEALSGTKILESANLLAVKSSTKDLEKQIIQILKKLDPDTMMKLIHHIEKLPFQVLFHVANIYRTIEGINETERYLDQRVHDFAFSLANQKQYDVALEVSQYLPDLRKMHLLEIIVNNLINEGRIIKALDIMNVNLENMFTPVIKKSICNIVTYPLKKNGQITKTMEVAITLLKSKDTDDLIKTTNAILFKNTCMIARWNYDFSSNFPIFKTYLEELLNCEAPFIERNYIYDAGLIPASILQNISLEFFKEGKEREAILVAKMIDDPVLQKQALIAIKGEETSDSYCIVM